MTFGEVNVTGLLGWECRQVHLGKRVYPPLNPSHHRNGLLVRSYTVPRRYF
jgi:hypothetical protein